MTGEAPVLTTGNMWLTVHDYFNAVLFEAFRFQLQQPLDVIGFAVVGLLHLTYSGARRMRLRRRSSASCVETPVKAKRQDEDVEGLTPLAPKEVVDDPIKPHVEDSCNAFFSDQLPKGDKVSDGNFGVGHFEIEIPATQPDGCWMPNLSPWPKSACWIPRCLSD
jgi:hypothetical protein